jgi:hypothetical protein
MALRTSAYFVSKTPQWLSMVLVFWVYTRSCRVKLISVYISKMMYIQMVLDLWTCLIWMSLNCFQWRRSGPELHLGWGGKTSYFKLWAAVWSRGNFPQAFPLGTVLFSFVVSHPNYYFFVVTSIKGIDERGWRARVVWLGKQRTIVSSEC